MSYFCNICNVDLTNKEGDESKSKRAFRDHKKTTKHIKKAEETKDTITVEQTSETSSSDNGSIDITKLPDIKKPQWEVEFLDAVKQYKTLYSVEHCQSAKNPWALCRMANYLSVYIKQNKLAADKNIDILEDTLMRRCNHKIYYCKNIDGSFKNFAKPLDDKILELSLELIGKYWPDHKLYNYEGNLVGYADYARLNLGL